MGKKFTQECVASYFAEHGCELLDDYKNSRIKLKYRCSCGNISYITLYHFKNGQRCKECGHNKNTDKKRYTHEEAVNFFKEHGHILMDQYISAHAKLNYQCKCGNFAKISLSCVLRGQTCRVCRYLRASGPNSPVWVSDRNLVKLTQTLGIRYNGMLKRTLNKKTNRSHKILGYTRKQLLQHITNHQNWNKVKDDNWQIDHIFPISAFIRIGITNPAIINNLDNLQPLTAIENYIKSDTYDSLDFKNYLESKNITVE